MYWLGFHKYGNWSVVKGGTASCSGAVDGKATEAMRNK